MGRLGGLADPIDMWISLGLEGAVALAARVGCFGVMAVIALVRGIIGRVFGYVVGLAGFGFDLGLSLVNCKYKYRKFQNSIS